MIDNIVALPGHLQNEPIPMPVKEYLTSSQLAAWLGVSLRTVYNLRRRRVLPFIKIGRLVRFRRHDVQRALKRYSVKGIEFRIENYP